jgi:hypothetical protein
VVAVFNAAVGAVGIPVNTASVNIVSLDSLVTLPNPISLLVYTGLVADFAQGYISAARALSHGRSLKQVNPSPVLLIC